MVLGHFRVGNLVLRLVFSVRPSNFDLRWSLGFPFFHFWTTNANLILARACKIESQSQILCQKLSQRIQIAFQFVFAILFSRHWYPMHTVEYAVTNMIPFVFMFIAYGLDTDEEADNDNYNLNVVRHAFRYSTIQEYHGFNIIKNDKKLKINPRLFFIFAFFKVLVFFFLSRLPACLKWFRFVVEGPQIWSEREKKWYQNFFKTSKQKQSKLSCYHYCFLHFFLGVLLSGVTHAFSCSMRFSNMTQEWLVLFKHHKTKKLTYYVGETFCDFISLQ